VLGDDLIERPVDGLGFGAGPLKPLGAFDFGSIQAEVLVGNSISRGAHWGAPCISRALDEHMRTYHEHGPFQRHPLDTRERHRRLDRRPLGGSPAGNQAVTAARDF
jgi:hypothetical protein